MKFIRNRKVVVGLSVVLALIITLSATFAWLTAKAQKENVFKNSGYSNSDFVVIDEYFPDPELKIGETNTKEVTIVNTGSEAALVRVTFEEMVKLLGNNGAITMTESSTPEAGMIPVPVNNELLTPGNGWTDITEDIDPAVPTGIKVFKKNNIYNGYYSYGTDPIKYQKISVSLTDNLDDTYTLKNNIKYAYYTDKAADYGSWNKQHNWAPWAEPVPLYTASSSDTPAAAEIYTSSLTLDVLLKYYDEEIATTPTQGKWYYNPNDGYFYWIGVLGGGESTDMLLSGVGIDGGANQAIWQKYEYTLIVALEVLQAHKSALTDTEAEGTAAGWRLNNPGDATLLGALEAAIDAYNTPAATEPTTI